MVNAQNWLRVAAFLGLLAVVAGAFRAHGLRGRLKSELDEEAKGEATVSTKEAGEARTVTASRRLEVYETGVRYHFWHVLALMGLGLLMLQTGRNGTPEALAGWGFCVGIVLFSGSLYALAFTGVAASGLCRCLEAWRSWWDGLAYSGRR